ncbi:MAG: DUF499 domain-containing protein [bacterium]|nr:DUF499 domain-containing protein [bacterium]
MKTLFELCKPRQSVFEETKREDVLNLSDLREGRIECDSFFEENYLTDGMNTLFHTAFNRFMKQGQTGVVKLTQAMGGGKTHNMLALGLLAANPEFRSKVLTDSEKYKAIGRVRVVAFSGRESDAPFGIWGSLAEQIGKKEAFSQYYSPLSAPGETAWINLLSGDPLLILIDELPPYLENAKSKTIGNSDLCAVTSTALANLFSAIGKAHLANVCLVISDLKAVYESGSELIRGAFRNLENEVNRSALDIEPVGSSSDDVYHILKKGCLNPCQARMKSILWQLLIKMMWQKPGKWDLPVSHLIICIPALKIHTRFIRQFVICMPDLRRIQVFNRQEGLFG